MQDMRDFEGLKAVVTGGGSGIGAATARLLANRGAAVAVLDLDPEAAVVGRAARVQGRRLPTTPRCAPRSPAAWTRSAASTCW